MMMLKKIFAAGLLALCSISMANADTLGARVGVGIWQPDVSGTFQFNGDSIDLQNDLFLQSGENQDYVYALFEHPIPLIPNIKISQTSLSLAGSGTVSADYNIWWHYIHCQYSRRHHHGSGPYRYHYLLLVAR